MNDYSIQLDSSTNKRILWDILKDNHVFDSMENSQYNVVKRTFDTVVYNASKKIENAFSQYSITDKNKMIIEQLIPAIESIQSSSQNFASSSIPATPSNPTMKVIYDANNMNTANSNSHHQKFHMKKSEQSQYNNEQFEQQKRERELSLDPKVPGEIDFSDKSLENDSPIGDDMDRLIAERLASRERELSMFPPPSPSPSPSPSLESKVKSQDNSENKDIKKNVSFSKEIEEMHEFHENDNDNNVQDTLEGNSDYNNTISIHSMENMAEESISRRSSNKLLSTISKLKLKRKDNSSSFSVSEDQYNNLLERIVSLEQQIQDILSNQDIVQPPEALL